MDNQGQRQAVYLKPGELHVAVEPTAVTTVLGSCVAVTFYTRRLRVGAICHALLPQGNCGAQPQESFRYLDCAVAHMLAALRDLGARAEQLEAKAFGGADVLSELGAAPGRKTVGAQNIQAAFTFLKNHGIALAAYDLGGVRGRKLIFHSDTGDIFLKRLRPSNAPPAGSQS